MQVNWKAMAQAPDDFFSAECVPADFVWTDPSMMQKEAMDKLLGLWYECQADGNLGLDFTGCLPKDFIKGDNCQSWRQLQEEDHDNDKGNDHQSPRPDADEDATSKGKGPVDELDENAPYSMLCKSPDEWIDYLRNFSVDKGYQKMVDVLAESDKVFILLVFIEYLTRDVTGHYQFQSHKSTKLGFLVTAQQISSSRGAQ